MQSRGFIQRLLFIVMLSVLFTGVFNAQDDQTDAYKAAIERLYEEALTGGDTSVLDELLAEDYVNHGLGEDKDRAAFAEYIEALHTALPDFEAQIEVLIAEGEWASSRVIYKGTFENPWTEGVLTVEPNHQPLQWSSNIFHRFNEDGLIVEEFTVFNRLSLLRQMDAAPVPRILLRLINEPQRPSIERVDPVIEGNEDNQKEAFMHIIEDAINNGDLTAIDRYMAEDHLVSEPVGNFTRANFRDVIATFREVVPDLHVDTEILIAEDDWLSARLIYTGTIANELPILPDNLQPIGKEIRFIVHVLVRYNEDGIGIEDYKEYNLLGWLQQLELVEAQ